MPGDLRARACISYWLPRLQAAGVPVPETRLVRTELDLQAYAEGEPGDTKGLRAFFSALREAAEEVGPYPVFLRTGHGSGKHEWLDTCIVQDPASLPGRVCNLVEWSHMVDVVGLPTNVWAVRKLLRLERAGFTAFRGMPVAKERRYFIDGGRVVCHHVYWPERALESGSPSSPDWRERLHRLNEDTSADALELTRRSIAVSNQFEGAWSLDWARDDQGTWWAIDMAPAELSYHWPGCPHDQSAGRGWPA